MKKTKCSQKRWNELQTAVNLCLRLLSVGAQKQSIVLLSFNSSTSLLALKLNNGLRAAGLSTWTELCDVGPGSNESISDAVEQKSAVLLICCSSGYRWSDSCKKVAEYAALRKVPLVFVRAEENYEPDGWLADLLGQKLYFDLTKDFDRNCAELITHINGITTTDRSSAEALSGAEGAIMTTSVEGQTRLLSTAALDPQEEPEYFKWTVDQVQKWLHEKELDFLLQPLIFRT